MGMAYIRESYGVPAKRGGRVKIDRFGYGWTAEEGVITGASDARLRVRIDGEKRSRIFHPTWQVEYL